MMMRQLMVCILLVAGSIGVMAQDDPEYRMEIGGGGGMVSYLGDFNSSPLKDMSLMGSLIAKYRPNPRMAWALNISYGQLKGSSTDDKSWFPNITEPMTFSHTLIDAGLRFEYNFWAYGTGQEYRGAKPLAPFIALGLGVAHVSASPSVFTTKFPLGLGLKYKIGDRLNLTAEWMMHFTGSDMLDGVEDPYGIKRSGLFKNTDCYSMLQFSLTYDIWAKCKVCHNDRE